MQPVVAATEGAVLNRQAGTTHEAFDTAFEAGVRLAGAAEVVPTNDRRGRGVGARDRQRVGDRPPNRIALCEIDQIAQDRGRGRQRAGAFAEQAEIARRGTAQIDGVVFLFHRSQQVPRRQQQRLDRHVERAVDARRAGNQSDAVAHRFGEVAVGRIDLADAADQKAIGMNPDSKRPIGENRQLGGGVEA